MTGRKMSMPLCLPGGVFFNLKDFSINSGNLRRNITQMQLCWAMETLIRILGSVRYRLQNALSALLDIVNITHNAYSFYHKPA